MELTKTALTSASKGAAAPGVSPARLTSRWEEAHTEWTEVPSPWRSQPGTAPLGQPPCRGQPSSPRAQRGYPGHPQAAVCRCWAAEAAVTSRKHPRVHKGDTTLPELRGQRAGWVPRKMLELSATASWAGAHTCPAVPCPGLSHPKGPCVPCSTDSSSSVPPSLAHPSSDSAPPELPQRVRTQIQRPCCAWSLHGIALSMKQLDLVSGTKQMLPHPTLGVKLHINSLQEGNVPSPALPGCPFAPACASMMLLMFYLSCNHCHHYLMK